MKCLNKIFLVLVVAFLSGCASTSYTKLLNDAHEEYWTKESYSKAETVVEKLEVNKSTYSDLAEQLPIVAASMDYGRIRFYVANGWLKDINYLATTDTTAPHSMVFGYIEQNQVHVKYKVTFQREPPHIITDIQQISLGQPGPNHSGFATNLAEELLTEAAFRTTEVNINSLSAGTDFFEVLERLNGAILHERRSQTTSDIGKGVKTTFLVGMFGYGNVRQPVEYKHSFYPVIPGLAETHVADDNQIQWIFGYKKNGELIPKIELTINNWKLQNIEYL